MIALKQLLLAMPNNITSYSKEDIKIDPYIKVEEVKDKQGRVVFRFIRFNLNGNILKKILDFKQTGQKLYISKNIKTQLQYCVLSDGENWYKQNRFQSGLTFCTYYELSSQTIEYVSEKMVMRSVVSFDGEIINQIRRDCLEDAESGVAIATAHHWVLQQLLNQLNFRINVPSLWLKLIPWGLSLLIVLVVSIILLATNLIPVPLTLLLMLVILVLLQYLFRRLLPLYKPLLRRWIARQFLSNFLSANSQDKNQAKSMLERF